MAPLLRDGDYALARNVTRRSPIVPGDIGLIDHPRYGAVIKQIAEILPDGTARLRGLGALSASMADLGTVMPHRIRARLVRRIAPGGVHRIRTMPYTPTE